METQIQQWQLTVPGHDNQATSSPDGFVARLSSLACHLYGMTLNGLSQKLPKSAYRKIERPYSYLRLWCDGYDAPSGNLDNILAESQRLRRSTVQLLASICRTLANRLAPSLKEAVGSPLMQKSAEARELAGVAADAMAEEDSSDSDSDSEDESPPAPGKYSIEDMVQDLETDIQCLLDLGPRYEEPIRDRRLDEKVARAADCATWNPAEYLASRIRHRYPDGDSPLLPVLGKANWDRILRLYQTKEKNERESRNHKARDRLESATVVASEFQDSGLGTSISASHSYAETVVSYHGSSGGPIRVPQLPEEAAGGKPFTCDICGDRVQIPTTRLWKKHVLSDLQPYSCIFPACEFASTPFADKKRWAEHLELDHDFAGAWKDMTCPVCQRHVGSVKTAVISHITRHLEEISLTILPTNAESEGDADDSTDEDSESEKSALGVAVMAKPVSIPRLPPGERRMPPVVRCAPVRLMASRAASFAQSSINPVISYPTASFADSFPRTSSQNPGKSNATPNVISSKDTNPVATSYTEDDENTHKDDGHSPTTTMYRCQFKPCPYKSKRKFDCKAHMEEVHAPAKFSMDSLELTFHSVEEANEFARCYRERQVQSLDEVESIAKEEDERFYRANEMAPSQLRDITIAKPVDAMTSNSTTTLPALRNHYEFTHGEQKYSLDEVGVLDVDDGKANDSNEEERRYCLCNGVSYGEMVLCDEHSCKREWFHLACVGLKTAPTALAKWYCPECRSSHVGGAKIPSNRYLPSAVSPGKYKCPECDMEFTENHKLALHICKDGFEKPFECQACQMHFGTVSDLVLHRKLHYDEKINPEGLNFPVDSGNLFSEPQQDSES